MSSDLTFITNEPNKSLRERFNVLIKDTRFFDVLVGYFYTSGFFALYKSLEATEKIRILIGINTNKQAYDLIQKSKNLEQPSFQFSHAEVKEEFQENVAREMEISEDKQDVEEGVRKFIEWLHSAKLEIRAYPAENIHAKLYIMTFAEGDRDKGRIITGSSNFTQSGLVDNLEFNVELKNRADYEFALDKFNELWKNSVDVSKTYLDTIKMKTWLNNTITPYELYIKFLYEYFKDVLNQSEELFYKYVPPEFKQLKYQEEAVLNAKTILEEYGGVFISDVVGLGKTYIAAMLANQLDGRTLVIAPPALIEKDYPGSWPNVFLDFRVAGAEYESIGKLDKLIEKGTDKFKNIIVDEAHRFRTETNVTYEQLAQICRGKRVILVTATPYNNRPMDILSQIKLFQKAKKSNIPNMMNLEKFFTELEKRLKGLDRQTEYPQYIQVAKQNAKEIREKVLKYLMVRRTRTEITKYFAEDLKEKNLKFPEVASPEAIFYELNEEEDRVFHRTVELIVTKFKYVRYTPLLYFTGEIKHEDQLSQINMSTLLKILLVKRLESSFFAFRNSLDRFIDSYQHFLRELGKGHVYISKKYTNKIFELLEDNDEDAIQELINLEKAKKYPASDFREDFKKDLEQDLKILQEIKRLWSGIKRDPKLLTFIDKLKANQILKNNKLIIFTESKETAEYLAAKFEEAFPGQAVAITGQSSSIIREKVIENFDDNAKHQKNDFRILITTEVMAEGVNLHRANVVINYDIPWNPTRLMQRVGRINRVDTKFDEIYTFNFFPTKQSNDQIKLKEAAIAKINAFISMLGADARLLTEGEPIESHELFSRLMSKNTIMGEDDAQESELKYLKIIRDIRDHSPELFEQIKHLPKKARTARQYPEKGSFLLTYFRKGKLQKFYMANPKADAEELDFLSAAKILEVSENTKREELGKDFYEMLEKNKEAFHFATTEELPELELKGGRDTATHLLKILKSRELKNYKGFTDLDELYIKQVIRQLEEGGLPKQTSKTVLKALNEEMKKGLNPLKILGIIRLHIPRDLLKETFAENSGLNFGPREVILSEYLEGK